MKESTTGRGPGTAFARPERESAEAVQEQRRRFVANPLAASMLDAMPGPALVLNSMRQVVAANPTFLAVVGAGDAGAVLARRPGEVLNCIHAAERPGGCGTSTACSACGAVHAFLAAMSTRADVVEEVRIRTSGGPDGGALDFRVKATFLSVDDEELVVVALQDISDEKRRQVLERVFFHDVLNTCGGVHGLAELLLVEELTAEKERRFKHEVHRLTGALIDEITGHRQMLAAERGRLDVELEDVSSRDLLEDVIGLYGHHQVAAGRGLRCAPREAVRLRTDPALLRRVLGNLVKNALEATPVGGTVTVSSGIEGDGVRFEVHNPGVMPERVQLQMFQRSFSTKGGEGRGIGTYSVKLLGERFLGGRVGFTSGGAAGTVFAITLPRAGPARDVFRAA